MTSVLVRSLVDVTSVCQFTGHVNGPRLKVVLLLLEPRSTELAASGRQLRYARATGSR